MEKVESTAALVENADFTKANNRGAYYRAAELMYNVAKRCFDLDLSEDTLIKWRYASVLIKKVDAVMDGEVDHLDKGDVMNYMIAKFGQVEESTNCDYPEIEASNLGFCANLLRGTIDDEQANNFLQRGLQALYTTEHIREAESAKIFAKMTAFEGGVTWAMYDSLVDEFEKTDGYLAFSDCMLELAGCSNIADSVMDLELDYESGLIALEPSMRNRLLILMEFFPPGVRCVRAMGLQAIHLAKLTIRTYRSSKV